MLPELFWTTTAVISLSLICLIISIFLLFIYRRRNDRYEQLAKLFPGPKPIPYFGNSLELLKTGQASSRKLLEYIDEYGSKPFRLWIGSELFVVVSDAEDIQVATKFALGKPELFTSFKDAYGDSVFTLIEEKQFKLRRKQLAHSFGSMAIWKYSSIIEKRIRSEIDVLNIYAKTGQMFNSWDHMPYVTFDIITKSMMDIELDHQEKEREIFCDANKQAINISAIRFLNPLSRNKYCDALLFGKIKNLSQTMFQFISRIIDLKMNGTEQKCVPGSETSDENDNAAGRYLETVYKLSLEEKNPSIVLEEMLLIIATGTDSTAIVISYTLLMLSIYPELQEKLFDELNEIFMNDDRETKPEDLERMTYTEQVINEALRHLTVAPYVFRRSEQEIKFKDFILPSHTNIMLFMLSAHYNPDYYPEPHKFNPDNFSSDAVASRPKCAFIPFVSGSRDCLGRKFAMLELKIIISLLLRTYKFSTNIEMRDVKHVRSFMSFVADNQYPLFIEERKLKQHRSERIN